jgi:hypothetical protein
MFPQKLPFHQCTTLIEVLSPELGTTGPIRGRITERLSLIPPLQLKTGTNYSNDKWGGG